MSPATVFQVRFFRTAGGNEPVRDWLKALDREDRSLVGRAIQKVEFGGPAIGKPTVDGFGQGLFEIRATIAQGGVEARVMFSVHGPVILLLHAFTKASRRTPQHEIQVARDRMTEARRTQQP